MKRALCIFALALANCCSDDVVIAPGEETYTTDEHLELEAAGDQWDTITVAAKQLHIVNALFVLDGDAYRFAKVDPQNGFNGGFSRGQRLIKIRPSVAGAALRAVALHELGHALGLRHLCTMPNAIGEAASERPCMASRSYGVMDPAHVTFEFSADDLAECRRARACRNE